MRGILGEDTRGKVEEVPEKKERWTYVYPVLILVLGWTLEYVVLR